MRGRTEELKRLGEGDLDLLAERIILDRLDGGDDGVDDLEALGELSEEVCGEVLPESILKDGGSDGDSPDLSMRQGSVR